MFTDTDVHVGQRVRHRRWALGMPQKQLADAVGVRFQQIQKYETGANRISASRLWDIARALDVPVAYLFEGLGEQASSGDNWTLGNRDLDKEAIEFAKTCFQVPRQQRQVLFDLARTMSSRGHVKAARIN